MENEIQATIQQLRDALNDRDINAVDRCVIDDCIFEETTSPNGTRYVGREAMLGAIEQFFSDYPSARFKIDEMFTAGDRVLIQWRYSWTDGHVRGVNVMRIHEGRVAESLGYLEG